MPSSTRSPRILIIAGEASGDLHGANLAAALRAKAPELSILGVGGPRMQAAGVELVQSLSHLNVIGIAGPSAVRALARRVLAIRRLLRRDPLDLVVLIDNPGLNFHFARVAKRAGRRVVYYIAPQLWAWRPRRMRWIQRRVDHVVVILPFEAENYRRAGVPCTFVGHPLLDEVAPSYDRERLRAAYGLPREACVIGLLPGSRAGEIRALLPVMVEAVQLLDVRLIARDPNGVMAAADLLFIASGTATLQAAIIGTPMVIVYKLPWLTYLLARLLVRVHSIGLANLVAGRAFIPELIQHHATPARLADQARRILDDASFREATRAEMARVRSLLGTPGASDRAAEVVLTQLRRREGGVR